MRNLVIMLSIFGLLGCNPRSPGPLSRSHQGNQGQCKQCHTFGFWTRTPPEKCVACHPDIARSIQAKRGYHASAQSPKILGTPCVRCHPEHRGPNSTLGLWTTVDQQDAFRPDHERLAGFPLRGKHATALCGECHTDHLPSGRRTYLTAQPACQGCHGAISPHGPLRDNGCQRCHTEAGWRPPQIWFDHQKETQYPLEGKHQEVPCTGCHKDRKFRMSIVQYADCSPCHQSQSPHGGSFGKEACRTCHSAARSFIDPMPFDHDRTRFQIAGGHDLARMKDGCQTCHKAGARDVPALECSSCHKNPHRTRFNRQQQCTACHVGTTWTESAFDHGKRTRFPLTANHVARTLKDCRSCHRGKGPSDFEDLRGLVTGSGPARSFPVNCLGCHEHAKAHNGQFTSGQCLNCHERPGGVAPKACRGPNGYREAECIKKMAWFGHGPGSPFLLTGGHDLARMKDKCQGCHRNRDPGEGFGKVPADCFSCHEKTDQQRGHRGALEQKCEECHDFSTGTWKNTVRFNHQVRFPLVGAHKRPTATCMKCHKGASLATAFKPRSTENRNCGDVECHKEKVKDSKHGDKYGDYCGDRAGCHDPRHGRFLDPRKLGGTNP